jgi:hypothetical protein
MGGHASQKKKQTDLANNKGWFFCAFHHTVYTGCSNSMRLLWSRSAPITTARLATDSSKTQVSHIQTGELFGTAFIRSETMRKVPLRTDHLNLISTPACYRSYIFIYDYYMSRDSSLGIATKLWAGRLKNRGWSPSRGNISVSSPQHPDQLWGPTSRRILGAVSPG